MRKLQDDRCEGDGSAAASTRRSVPEWVGKTPDAKIPPRVRLRVFDRFHGVCQISKRKIAAGERWECDHIVALANGGEHRESNLQPVLRDAHRAKTRQDVRQKSESDRKRKRHLGIEKSKSKIPGSRGTGLRRRLDGTVIRDPEW